MFLWWEYIDRNLEFIVVIYLDQPVACTCIPRVLALPHHCPSLLSPLIPTAGIPALVLSCLCSVAVQDASVISCLRFIYFYSFYNGVISTE